MDYSWRLYALINIAGCVKKESKKITTGSSVDKIVKEKTEKKKLRIQNVKKRKNSRKRTARKRPSSAMRSAKRWMSWKVTI